MRRLSIRTLMAFVLIFAVGLAALRNANDLWAGVMLLFALAVVGVAVIGGVILRGRERCWWAGFAFFGGGYLALAIGPWFGSADQSRLVTTHLLESVRAKVVTSNIARFEMSALDRSSVRLRVMTDDGGVITKTMAKSVVNSTSHSDLLASMTPANRWHSALPGAANHESFLLVGHSLFALLAAFLGGTVAVRFYARRNREADEERGPSSHERGSSDVTSGL